MIDSESLAAVDNGALIARLLEIAQTLISEIALKYFIYQERYLLEALGCYLCTSGDREESETASENSGEAV